jgi:hypothetical protein
MNLLIVIKLDLVSRGKRSALLGCAATTFRGITLDTDLNVASAWLSINQLSHPSFSELGSEG